MTHRKHEFAAFGEDNVTYGFLWKKKKNKRAILLFIKGKLDFSTKITSNTETYFQPYYFFLFIENLEN